MSRHEGVSCDSCLRNNFKGRRYKCLICYDYDLCGNCFETGAASARHLSSHAMQCMLPRAEYELYYQGESGSVQSEVPLSLTCPYCAKMGLTEATLYDHVCCEHADVAIDVVCPICASQPGGEPNNVVLDFVAHIQREHRTAQDDSHLEPHERQQSRRMPMRGASSNRGNAVSSGGLARGASRRIPFGSAPLSPRESTMESITEILSQLTAAGRRNHSGQNSSAQHTIQQLQMQLDRQNPQMTRQQLDKISRRGPSRASLGSHNPLEPTISSASLSAGVGSLLSAERQGVFGGPNNSTGGCSQFLLARYVNENGTESSKEGRGSKSADPDRAQFVENLLLNTLLPNSSLWRIRTSQRASSSGSDKSGESAAAATATATATTAATTAAAAAAAATATATTAAAAATATAATAAAAAAAVTDDCLEEQSIEYVSGPEEEPCEGLQVTTATNEPGDELSSDVDVSPEPRRRRSSRYRNEPASHSNK